MRNTILDEVTDAAGESSKIPRLQRALQEFDENFDVIGLINFNWDHTVGKPLSKWLRGRSTPEAKSAIIKNKYAVRYLAGQEKVCRLSGVAQNITPELLQLRQRDQDMHTVLKVALQPWPTLAGLKTLTEFGVNNNLFDSYFRADYFCKYYHEDEEYRHKLRKTAVDRAASEGSGTIVPIVSMDKFFYEKKAPRTIADLNDRVITGSSSSLSRTALETLPSRPDAQDLLSIGRKTEVSPIPCTWDAENAVWFCTSVNGKGTEKEVVGIWGLEPNEPKRNRKGTTLSSSGKHT